MAKKLKGLQRHLDDGILLPDATLTVSQLFNGWYEDVLRHQVAPRYISTILIVTQ